jgi:hypothetical protein
MPKFISSKNAVQRALQGRLYIDALRQSGIKNAADWHCKASARAPYSGPDDTKGSILMAEGSPTNCSASNVALYLEGDGLGAGANAARFCGAGAGAACVAVDAGPLGSGVGAAVVGLGSGAVALGMTPPALHCST